MNDTELRGRCASLALGGMVELPGGGWSMSPATLTGIHNELAKAGPLLPRMLTTLGLFAMWIPSYRQGSEQARDALLGVIASWQARTATADSPASDTLRRFTRRAPPPPGSHKALPGAQFAITDARAPARHR